MIGGKSQDPKNLPVNKCDLLSVRITSTGRGALEDGVAVTILYTVP